MLQFNVDMTVVSVSRWSYLDKKGGRVVAFEPADPSDSDVKGIRVQEMSCEHEVFDQVPANWKSGDNLTLIATLRTAKDSNQQRVQKIHILGVVPSHRQAPSAKTEVK